MINNNQVAEGLMAYMKKEVLPVLPSYAKVLAGAVLLHNANRMTSMLTTLTSGKLLQTIDVVNSNGEIDIDLWCQDLKRSMEEFCGGRVEVQLPAMSPLIFTTDDIETMKRYMRGELR